MGVCSRACEFGEQRAGAKSQTNHCILDKHAVVLVPNLRAHLSQAESKPADLPNNKVAVFLTARHAARMPFISRMPKSCLSPLSRNHCPTAPPPRSRKIVVIHSTLFSNDPFWVHSWIMVHLCPCYTVHGPSLSRRQDGPDVQRVQFFRLLGRHTA